MINFHIFSMPFYLSSFPIESTTWNIESESLIQRISFEANVDRLISSPMTSVTQMLHRRNATKRSIREGEWEDIEGQQQIGG